MVMQSAPQMLLAGVPSSPHDVSKDFCFVAVQISTLKVGDRVASAFSTSCGQCYYCEHALSCRCEKGGRFGWIVDGKGIEGSQVKLAAACY